MNNSRSRVTDMKTAIRVYVFLAQNYGFIIVKEVTLFLVTLLNYLSQMDSKLIVMEIRLFFYNKMSTLIQCT